ncbi:DUF1850 domain-containing protein [Oceanobacillus caeni]|uniref:RocC n=1 Tax=Oceanobacillus caeni TaxID=405946 RepID=A0ABR5MIJ1_9BACI|nr:MULTISPECIES: DUF1850 domain-containing protein [Bacillaceae]KPH74291.1 hypothetical protein AFL42_10685 [Oceanobacillus caeni]MBU8790630.1 DUF1850 domain-containing protein [Oceanobacillus caeni]MCR1834113.1 DUF1850 domain-containing protein [Oceanobacillus caeni]
MKYKRLLLSFVMLLILIIALFIPFRTALVFYKENTPNIEAFLPIKKGDTFQIIFKHSIHLTDVVEKYKVTKDLEIKQYEFVYEEFGIGMPSNAEEGETFVYEDGKYHIKNMDNVFPEIKVRNGKTVSENRLVWGTKDNEDQHMVWFNDYFEPGAWFTIKVKSISLWEMMGGVEIHE